MSQRFCIWQRVRGSIFDKEPQVLHLTKSHRFCFWQRATGHASDKEPRVLHPTQDIWQRARGPASDKEPRVLHLKKSHKFFTQLRTQDLHLTGIDAGPELDLTARALWVVQVNTCFLFSRNPCSSWFTSHLKSTNLKPSKIPLTTDLVISQLHIFGPAHPYLVYLNAHTGDATIWHLFSPLRQTSSRPCTKPQNLWLQAHAAIQAR